jgi:hypothetical protein
VQEREGGKQASAAAPAARGWGPREEQREEVCPAHGERHPRVSTTTRRELRKSAAAATLPARCPAAAEQAAAAGTGARRARRHGSRSTAHAGSASAAAPPRLAASCSSLSRSPSADFYHRARCALPSCWCCCLGPLGCPRRCMRDPRRHLPSPNRVAVAALLRMLARTPARSRSLGAGGQSRSRSGLPQRHARWSQAQTC